MLRVSLFLCSSDSLDPTGFALLLIECLHRGQELGMPSPRLLAGRRGGRLLLKVVRLLPLRPSASSSENVNWTHNNELIGLYETLGSKPIHTARRSVFRSKRSSLFWLRTPCSCEAKQRETQSTSLTPPVVRLAFGELSLLLSCESIL